MSWTDEADQFCRTLANIVNGTVARGAEFDLTPVAGVEQAFVLPRDSAVKKPKPIGIVTGPNRNGEPRLWLSVLFRVGPDDRNEHMAVLSSAYSLLIDAETNRPAVRIEYERDGGYEPGRSEGQNHRRPAAHVQIDGSSEPIAFVQGLNGEKRLRGLGRFHIPVGGRRYRPTLEDFIEFLFLEKLIPNLHPSGRQVIDEHRNEWMKLQLRAAIRNDPGVAVEKLEDMGYVIQNPARS